MTALSNALRIDEPVLASYIGAMPHEWSARRWMRSCTLLLCIVLLAPLSVLASSLVIDEGVVVKFGAGAGLNVRSALHVAPGVVFTDIYDDAAANQTPQNPGKSTPGSWRGVRVAVSVPPASLVLNQLDIRYAGYNGSAALELRQHDYLIDQLSVSNSMVGLEIGAGSAANITAASLVHNGIGVRVLGDAVPSISGSNLSGNLSYGVLNLTPATVVQAGGNWWGDATGPQHANNPGGQGDAVSDGVVYPDHLGGIPLNGCSVDVADGIYTVAHRTIRLSIACRNATSVRVSEDPAFDNGLQQFDFIGQSEILFELGAQPGARRIHAQFQAATGNTVEVQTPSDVIYQPDAPAVAIVAPAQAAVIAGDTLIQAVASDAVAVQSVSFFVNGGLLAVDDTAPYEALWALGGLPDGSYVLRARALNLAGVYRDAQITVSIGRGPPDTEAPIISDIRLAGQPLQDGATVTEGGVLSFLVEDPSGVAHASVTLAGVPVPGGFSGHRYSAPMTFDAVTNGVRTVVIQASDPLSNAGSVELDLDVQIPPPSPPQFLAPASGAVVSMPQVSVAGVAAPGSQVQLYLDGAPVAGSLIAGPSGAFNAMVALPSEGEYALQATASSSRGTSALSNPGVTVTFSPSPPSVLLINPQDGAIIAEDVEIEAHATDAIGIHSVEISIDGVSAATIAEPPYSWAWSLDTVDDGPHVIRAEATNVLGKVSAVEHSVVVERPSGEPPQVVTPYTGIIDGISPAISYGDHNVAISGRTIVSRTDETAVPNALVALVLDVQGFQRRINVTSNQAGAFAFTFVPGIADTGIYKVGARHPDEATAVFDPARTFTINRLGVRPSIYRLHAAYGAPATVNVELSASAGTGINGVTFAPAHALPEGVSLEPPVQAVDVPAGQRVTVPIQFTADDDDDVEDGSVVLDVFSSDSGQTKRETFKIEYRLSQPRPLLQAHPRFVHTGVVRGESLTELVTIKNQGLAPSGIVQVQLRDQNGGLNVPYWISLASAPNLGSLGVGDSRSVQIAAAPSTSIAEGMYSVYLRVMTGEQVHFDLPISIAVRQDGIGSAKFLLSDIYTGPTGLPRVPNARVRLQNEVMYTDTYTANSGESGEVLFENIPAGRYVYRVTGPSHIETTGRIHVRPGITVEEEVFLDYNLVTFEWSVTETFIRDEYNVVVEAIFQTQVPAPVVVIQPSHVNLPPMQQGEEITGTLTISNYGLVRADDVEFTPAPSDQHYQFEFLGDVPTELAAQQRVNVQYKITALAPFPPSVNAEVVLGKLVDTLLGRGDPAKSGACSVYGNAVRLRYRYQCANETVRSGSGQASFGRVHGSSCHSNVTTVGGVGVAPWTYGGPWGGGTYIGSGGPTCMPECNACPCQGAAGGGGGGGGGGGSGGGGGDPPPMPTR